jgi:ParB/RepB/Spo0J family partition protein
MLTVSNPASSEAGGETGERDGNEAVTGGIVSLVDLQQVPVDRIDTPGRPVRRFLGDIAALAESMQDFGLQQPISVRREGDRFVLTSGLRRLAAARMLQWQTIPGFVRNVSADHAYVLDLIENLQRQDLSPEEEADALGELIRTRGWTLQQVADTIKRSLGYVSKRVRLFEDAVLRDAVANRGMPVSTAEELLAAPPDQRARFIDQALAERWDQVRARDVLRAAEPSNIGGPGDQDPVQGGGTLTASDIPHEKDSKPNATLKAGSSVRPRDLTRAIREFHRLIVDLHAQDLTGTDRAALRSLFRDLLLLARSPGTGRVPVFPPLPTAAGSSGMGSTRPPQVRRVASHTRTATS